MIILKLSYMFNIVPYGMFMNIFYIVIKIFSLPFYLIDYGNFASLFEKFSYFPVEMDEYLYVWYRSLSLCCSTVRFMLLLLHLALYI